MITTKAVMDRLPEDAGIGPVAPSVLARFRREFHACLTARADELSELTDAVLCSDGRQHQRAHAQAGVAGQTGTRAPGVAG